MLSYIILKNILYYLFWSVPTVFYEAWNNRDTIDDEDWNQSQPELKL